QPSGDGRQSHAAGDLLHPRGLPGGAGPRRLVLVLTHGRRILMAVTTPPVVAGGLGRSWRRRSAGLLLSLLALTALMAISVTLGSRAVAAEDILSAFGGSTDGFGPAAVAKRIPAPCSPSSWAPPSASP